MVEFLQRRDNIHIVPLEQFDEQQAEALLSHKVPNSIPIHLYVAGDAGEQEYSTEGLTAFRSKMAEVSSARSIQLLTQLCDNVLTHPILLNRHLHLLAEDRVFWDERDNKWRFLALLSGESAWGSLPEITEESIWNALLASAAAVNTGTESLLKNIGGLFPDEPFSTDLLKRRLALALERSAGKEAAFSSPAEPNGEDRTEIHGKPESSGFHTDTESPAHNGTPRLTCLRTGDSILLDRSDITIGSEASSVDFPIRGNSAVSRHHAKLIRRGSDLCLVDTNSTNGVYVDGRRLERGVETPLSIPADILLADEPLRLSW